MRLRKNDWLAAGLRLLTRAGPEALTIDRLCQQQQVTKGSFYHHFEGREDYLHSLMQYWREQHTERLIATTEAAEPEARSDLLSQMARSADAGVENAMRTWARQDPAVAEQVATVDRARVAYLHTLIAPYLTTGQDGALVTKLVYAHFVGVQQLPELISADEWAAMDALLQELFKNPQAKG